jgi:hypothetical protein
MRNRLRPPLMRYPHRLPDLIVARGLVAWYDFLQGSNAQVLYDRSGNGYHGQLGSTSGADVNDPSWTAQGQSFGADDYDMIGGNLGVLRGCQMVFTVPQITPATTTLAPVAFRAGDYLSLGSITAGLDNEIITLTNASGARSAWCDAAGSIAAGTHVLDMWFDGSQWCFALDGVSKTITTAGSPVAVTASAMRVGNGGGTWTLFFNGGQAHTLLPYSVAPTVAEFARNRNYLRAEMARRGATPLW